MWASVLGPLGPEGRHESGATGARKHLDDMAESLASGIVAGPGCSTVLDLASTGTSPNILKQRRYTSMTSRVTVPGLGRLGRIPGSAFVALALAAGPGMSPAATAHADEEGWGDTPGTYTQCEFPAGTPDLSSVTWSTTVTADPGFLAHLLATPVRLRPGERRLYRHAGQRGRGPAVPLLRLVREPGRARQQGQLVPGLRRRGHRLQLPDQRAAEGRSHLHVHRGFGGRRLVRRHRRGHHRTHLVRAGQHPHSGDRHQDGRHGRLGRVWTYGAHGSIVNDATGQRLYTPGGHGPGHRVELRDCTGKADQRWTAPRS